MKKEKVLLIGNDIIVIYNFRCELITELLKRGFEVYFSVPNTSQDCSVKLLVDMGARHLQTPLVRRSINVLKEIKLIFEYCKLISRIDPSIILTYTVKPNIFGTFAASIYNKPVIINVTGLGSTFTDSRIKPIVERLYKYACRKAYYIYFQNESNYKLFLTKGLVAYTKSKVIPGSGVNLNRFMPLVNDREDGITRFLYIGRIMKEKGVEEYLKAAEIITEKFDNTEFLLLGAFEEDSYRNLVLCNRNPKIKYLGVSNDVRNEVKMVDCIINPSYHEGLSNVLLEGASMGKPLIASDIPGCREIIDKEYNGFLFKPADVEELVEKVSRFLNLSREEQVKMGQASRMKVEKNFDRKIIVEEYIGKINCILDQKE